MTDARASGARTAVPPMTNRRLDWALRARGPALARWPDGERAAALALLVRSRRARETLGDALARDADRTPHDPVALARMQARLHSRLAARTAPVAGTAGAMAAGAIPGVRWGALAACALAGLWLGLAAPAPDARPDFFAAAPDPFSAPLPPPAPVPDAENL